MDNSKCLLTKQIAPFFLTLIFLFNYLLLTGQTCTINSGVDLNECEEDIFLDGFASPITVDLATIQWSLVSQPAGANIIIDDPNSLVSSLSGIIINGVYTFGISGECGDGSGTASDEVIHTINLTPQIPENGTYDFGCYTSGGIVYDYSTEYTLQPNEEIIWSFSDGGTGILTNANTLTPTFSPNPILDYCPEQDAFYTKFIITITNTVTGCFSYNTQTLYYEYGERPVEVRQYPTNICGLCTSLLGTCEGGDDGQWTASGPGNVTFGNPNHHETSVCVDNPGTYTFTWTITGACVNGSDDITVKFNNFGSGTVWPYAGEDLKYCDFPSTVAMNASPLENGQTGTWIQSAGPPVTFANPNDPNTLVNGLIAGSTYYEFIWTVCGVGCCVSDEVELYENPKPIFQTETLFCSGSPNFLPNFASTNLFPFNNIDTFWMNINLVAEPELSTGVNFQLFRSQWTLSQNNSQSHIDYSPVLTQGESYLVTLDPDDLPALNPTSFGRNPLVKFYFKMEDLNSNVPVPGYYEFELTYSFGCETKSLTIQKYVATEGDASPNAGTDAILPCGVNDVILSGSNNLAYNGIYFGEWSMISGPGPDPFGVGGIEAIQQAPSLTGLTDGVYTFRLTNTALFMDYCNIGDPIDEMKIVVSNTSPGPVTTSLNQVEVCSGGIANITGTEPLDGIGVWTQTSGPSATIVSPNLSTTDISGLQGNTTYEFTWTITNSCGVSSDALSFTTSSNIAPSEANITTTDYCNISLNNNTNYSINISADNPINGTGVWSLITQINQPSANLSSITANSVLLSGIDGSVGGLLEVAYTVTNGSCMVSSADTVFFQIGDDADIQIDAGQDVFLCDVSSLPVTATANAVEVGIDAFQKWTQLLGPSSVTFSDSEALNPTLTFYSYGNYFFKVQNFWSENCASQSEDVVMFVVSPPAPPAFAGEDQNACGGSGVFTLDALDLGVGETGNWVVSSTTGSTVNFVDESDPNTQVTIDGTGIINLKWQTFNENSTCSPNQDIMEIYYFDVPSVQSDVSLCGVSNISISGEDFSDLVGITSSWSHSGPGTPTILSPASSFSNVTNLVPGIHTFTYEITDGSCTQNNSFTVTIDEFIQADAGPDQTFCGGETISLTGNVPSSGSVEWKLFSGTNSGSFSGSFTNTATYGPIMADSSYIFSYSITNGTCVSTDMVFVHVLEESITSFSVIDATCTLSTGSIDLIVEGGNIPPLSYLWSTGATTEDLTNVSGGLYAVTVSHPSGCSIETIAPVESTDGPIINNFDDQNICGIAPVTFSPLISGGSGAPYSYVWSTGETTSTISISATENMILGLEVTDNSGCTTAKTIALTVRKNPDISLPDFYLNCSGTGVELTPSVSPEIWNLVYEEGFEDNSYGWVNDVATNAYNWYPTTGLSSNSNSAGATTNIEGNKHLYVSSRSPYGNRSGTINSVNIDLSTTTTPYVIFYYTLYPGTGSYITGTLDFEVSVDGSNWTNIWTKSGNQGPMWKEAVIDISAYAGSSTFYGRFTYTDANTFSNAIIDHFRVGDPTYSFEWSTGSTARNISVNPASNTTYTVTVTDGFGCPEIVSTEVVNDCIIDIGDYVWEDTSNDGIQDIGESGINGIPIHLYEDFDGDLVPDGAAIQTTITTANGGIDGYYEFTNLDISGGDYRWIIEVDLPFGTPYTYVPTFAGNDQNVDSDLIPNLNYIIAETAVDDFSFDAGLYKLSSISDFVWLDDGDGIQENGESGVSGVVVRLLDNLKQPIKQTVTDAYGHYKFDRLNAGDYYVEFFAPVNYVFAPQASGANEVDSDVNIYSGQSNVINLLSGEDYIDADAGLVFKAEINKAAIGDYVWLDTNLNGLQDPSEGGVANITVSLYDISGDLISSTITNERGFYIFDDIEPGTYTVGFSLPSGYQFTMDHQGSSDLDSDVMPAITAGDLGNRTENIVVAAGEYKDGIDAGIIPVGSSLGSLGDFVFYDNNRDGLQNPNEMGVAGVRVILYAADGITKLATQETDGLGFYQFNGLSAGNYFVKFDPISFPINYVLTNPNMGTDFAIDSDPDISTGLTLVAEVVPGYHFMTLDAGLYNSTTTTATTASVGDFVWYDNNLNDKHDMTELGVPGVMVELYDNLDNLVARTLTNSNGYYKFYDITPGDYYVTFNNIPEGYTFFPIRGDNYANSFGQTTVFTVNGGDNYSMADAGIQPGVDPTGTATIGDQVFYDKNNNGIKDNGELGVSNIKVHLLDDQGNPFDIDPNTSGIQPLIVLTNDFGSYLFTGLPSGKYIVEFDPSSLPANYNFSAKHIGIDGTIDSDADPISGKSDVITLMKGQDNLEIDAGIYNPSTGASLGDFVFFDADNNGYATSSEKGVRGVRVTLYNTKDEVIGITTTNFDGKYIFTDLDAGDYYVEFSDYPEGMSFTNQVIYSTAGSDPDPLTGLTNVFSISAGQNKTDVDAGLISTRAILGNYIWLDEDKDGVQDFIERSIAGVTVNLFDSNADLVASAITDANGNYLFPNLLPDDYTIQLATLPIGSKYTSDTHFAEASNSDINPVTGISETVTLIANQIYFDLDGGIYVPALGSISNFVWADKDSDGIQDLEEPGVPGVTVTLYNNATGEIVGTAITDGNGNYLFDHVPEGTYYLIFSAIPPTSSFTIKDAGLDGEDSDVNAATGQTDVFSIEEGEFDVTLDVGIVDVLLPIEMLYFESYIEDCIITLNWATASEVKNDYFIIERKVNENDWIEIGRVDGNGTTNETNYYEFNDSASGEAWLYYRLVQVDFDGKNTISEIQSLTNPCATNLNNIKIYPNPVANESINLIMNFTSIQGKTTITVFDNLGRKLIERLENVTTEFNHLIIETNTLSAGVYYIQVEAGDKTWQQKVVKLK